VVTVAIVVSSVTGMGGVIPRVPTSVVLITGGAIDHKILLSSSFSVFLAALPQITLPAKGLKIF
jgi:hypothetical protein